MNPFGNPTALQVGMSGTLCGIPYHVAGRVVLGADVDGETCYWNEYHLVDDRGQSATLVFEETENGPEWKLFSLFEPVSPMTVAEAARKRVGDTVNLDGKPIQITLVGQSRVYHIEGRAPEGVEVGDVAHYFNADTGVEMQVVSWTGDEIEFYRGIDVPMEEVAAAFRLPAEKLAGSGLVAEQPLKPASTSLRNVLPLVSLGILVVVAWVAFLSYSKPECASAPFAPKRVKTLPARLSANASGTLHGRLLAVRSHAVVEVARVGLRYPCHEYTLSDGSLLIHGLNGQPSDWHLLRPAALPASLTPTQAAALRAGDRLTLDGVEWTVRDLFQLPGAGKFGLLAQSDKQWAVLRWTPESLEGYLGGALTEKEVLEAFR